MAHRERRPEAGLEFLDSDDLIRLVDVSPTIVPGLYAMLTAIGGALPPVCGGCEAELMQVPALWVFLRRGGGVVVSGFCSLCEVRDRIELGRAVLAYAGAKA
jgi:hypothetical protein